MASIAMQTPTRPVAIVGAGASGLAAAWQLSQLGIPSTIFEKSRGLSGRAATRRKHGHHYDHGANFFRLDDPEVARLLRKHIPTDGLVEIPGDVWTFDAEGNLHPGDPAHNAVPKWTYRDGINTLGKHLLAASPMATAVRETHILRIGKNDDWWLDDDSGKRHAGFRCILLTPPTPQSATILRDSGIDDALATALDSLQYHPQFSLILGYHTPPLSERPFHALVNLDGRHPLAWLSFEEDKPGHVADGASVIVAQLSPAWSANHYETPPETWLKDALAIIRDLLRSPLPTPDWWDTQRWRYAHPVPGNPIPTDALRSREIDGIFLAGDGLLGKGRVPLAIRSGLDAAKRIATIHPITPPRTSAR
jgi:predicted NAD/FAD-dependent oxidoreductase